MKILPESGRKNGHFARFLNLPDPECIVPDNILMPCLGSPPSIAVRLQKVSFHAMQPRKDLMRTEWTDKPERYFNPERSDRLWLENTEAASS